MVIGINPQSTIDTRASAVKATALALGFDAVGIASARETDPEQRFAQWLDRGYQANMRWIEDTRELRADVRKWLPGAMSVIVVARNYYRVSTDPLPSGTRHGKVARYAWGRDYHRVLKKPLKALAASLMTLDPATRNALSVDSGPILERTWAMHAGVGWIGRNALVIRQGLGSWFFLAAIATTLELAEDSPATDRCGTCRLCLDACPTGAIVEARVVDSRRCISYQTIENRTQIPDELAPKLSGWVFGCDICQEVCPWNRQAPETDEADFSPRAGQTFLDLDEIAEMTDDSYLERFAGTPLMRAKRTGLQRNASALRALESGDTPQ